MRVDPHDRALRQPETGSLQAAAARLEAGKAFDAVTQGVADVSAVAIVPEAAKADLSAEAIEPHIAKAACAAEALSTAAARRREVSSVFQVPAEDTPADSGTLAAKTFRSEVTEGM